MQREKPATTTTIRSLSATAMAMAWVLAGCSATTEPEAVASPVVSPAAAESAVESPTPSPSTEQVSEPQPLAPDEARAQARVLGFGPSPDGNESAVYASTDGMHWTLVAVTEAPYRGTVLTDGSRERLLAYQGIMHRQNYGYISEDRGLSWTLMGEQEFVAVNEDISPSAALGHEWFALLADGISVFAAQDAHDWQRVASLDAPHVQLHGTGDTLILLRQDGQGFTTSLDGREWRPSELDLGGSQITDLSPRGDDVWILTLSKELWRADSQLSSAELVSNDPNLRRIDSIAVVDERTIIAVRESPHIVLVSEDGGVTWEDRRTEDSPTLALVVAVEPA